MVRFVTTSAIAVSLLAPSIARADEHLGTIDDSLVGIEVSMESSDGAVRLVRRGCGVIIRCDGFVLAPSALFSKTLMVAGREETGKRQAVTVVLHPGRPDARSIAGRRPRSIGHDMPFAVLKLDDVHSPALRTLLPTDLQPDDRVTLVACPWDTAAKAFAAPLKADVRFSSLEAADDNGCDMLLADRVETMAGAALIGPQGLLVGLVPGAGAGPRAASMARLGEATNCVTPLSTTKPGAPGGSGMVRVTGGPIDLPTAVLENQPDMEKARGACIGSFEIDEREVSNRDYLEYWLSRPASDRKRLGYRTRHYPLAWAAGDTPFTADVADLPVIGVPLAGARAYAEWRGKRLPTPAEWCAAAFGSRGPSQPPDWCARYVADRRMAWEQVRQVHEETLRMRPELQTMGLFVPDAYHLPWATKAMVSEEAAAWSRTAIERVVAQMRQVWHEPHRLIRSGGRDNDIAECGARDLLLNAAELVAPPPALPAARNVYWLQAGFPVLPPGRNDLWAPRSLEVLSISGRLPLLSRLYRRTIAGPANEDLLALSNLSEALFLLPPVGLLDVRAGWDLDVTASTWPSKHRGAPQMPAGYSVWRAPSGELKREMGRDVPLNSAEPHGLGGAQLFYVLPVGFRCAR